MPSAIIKNFGRLKGASVKVWRQAQACPSP